MIPSALAVKVGAVLLLAAAFCGQTRVITEQGSARRAAKLVLTLCVPQTSNI